MKHRRTCQLGTVLDISKEKIEPTEHPGKSFNYVGLEHIEGHTGKLLLRTDTRGAEIKSTKHVFHKDEILYGKLRPYLNKVHLAAQSGICSTDILVLKPKEAAAVPAFVAYFLRSPIVLGQVEGLTQGANLPRLNPSALLGLPIPTPTLSEQKRIVAILDAAEELRHLRERADRRTADLIPALFHEMFGNPATNPKGWPETTVDNVAVASWGNTSLTKRSYTETGFPAYSATGQDGLISHAEHEGEGIVLSAIGARCGKCFWASGSWTAIKNTITITKPVAEKLTLGYLYVIANDEGFWTKRGVAQPFITLGNVRGKTFPLPPFPLQCKFVTRVAEIRAMEAQQSESRRRLDDLFQSLLHRAFRGELVTPAT